MILVKFLFFLIPLTSNWQIFVQSLIIESFKLLRQQRFKSHYINSNQLYLHISITFIIRWHKFDQSFMISNYINNTILLKKFIELYHQNLLIQFLSKSILFLINSFLIINNSLSKIYTYILFHFHYSKQC